MNNLSKFFITDGLIRAGYISDGFQVHEIRSITHKQWLETAGTFIL